jgi:hypothetical protein
VDTTYGNKYLGFGSLSLNEWTYLTVVFKDGYLATFSNGKLIGVETNVTRIKYGGEYLTLGISHSFNNLYNGEIDELRISNIARSSAWIEAQYLSMTGRLVAVNEKYEIHS